MIARIVPENGSCFLWFWCAGCGTHHRVPVTGSRAWGWNGNVDAPTLTPSILVTYDGIDAGVENSGAPPKVCHSYVTDGAIQYLGDSTHALAGQTVALEDLP